MNNEIELRCSELPRAILCPGSVRGHQNGAVRVDPVSDEATMGTAAHEALQDVARTGFPDWDRIGEIAARHGSDADEVRMLAAMGAKLWAPLKAEFPDAQTEIPMAAELASGVSLRGTADIIAADGTTGRIADWKTGRVDHSYREQLRGYAGLLLLDNPDFTRATATVLWVRDGDAEHYTMDRSALAGWKADVVDAVTKWDGTLRPGSHCGFCPVRHSCPGAKAMASADVAVVLGSETALDLATLTPEQQVDLYDRTARVEKLAKRVREAMREHMTANGPIVAGGERIALAPVERRELDPTAAWPVLRDAGLEDADIAAVMDLRIGRIGDVVAKKAGRGKGAAAVREMDAKLQAAGAVTTTTTYTTKRSRA